MSSRNALMIPHNSVDVAQWIAKRKMIMLNAQMMMAKEQDCYTRAVYKKRHEETFQVDKKVWLDSKNFGYLQNYPSSGSHNIMI